MQHRISIIAQKLSSLGANVTTRGLIDVDLMLDYTRVLYADLLELRQSMTAHQEMHINEPTLDELTEAMMAAEAEEEEVLLEAEPEPKAESQPAQKPEPLRRSPEPVTQSQTRQEFEAAIPHHETHQPIVPAAPFLQKPHPMPAPVSKKLLFEDMIGINDRYLFQQELFHNDHVLYHKAIEAINNAGSMEEVNDWLQNQVTGHRNWDLYGEAGSTFYAILNRYFEQ